MAEPTNQRALPTLMKTFLSRAASYSDFETEPLKPLNSTLEQLQDASSLRGIEVEVALTLVRAKMVFEHESQHPLRTKNKIQPVCLAAKCRPGQSMFRTFPEHARSKE